MITTNANLPTEVVRELVRFIRDTDSPLAVRDFVSGAFVAGYGSGLSHGRALYVDLEARVRALETDR